MNESFVRNRLDGTDKVWNALDYTRDGIIEASAGTGKTYTLQSIVLKLLTEKIVDSVKSILLVTFTEKAAGELRDRIRQILMDADCLPDDFDEVNICTIHSFCRELLTEYAFENGVPMKTEIAASDDDLIDSAVRTALKRRQNDECYSRDYGQMMDDAGLTSTEMLIERVRANFGREPIEVPVSKSGKDTKEVVKGRALAALVNPLAADAKDEYERLKKQSSVMTFDDMVAEASRVIAEQADDSELLKSIRRKYRVALVDEFQDTDSKQWNIFSRIFSSEVNRVPADAPKPQQGFLLVVGDPKQAIYSFRGADVGTYLVARGRVGNSQKGGQGRKTLDTTFRSSPELVAAFNKMFQRGSGWFEDMSSGGEAIEYEKDVNPPPESTPKFHGLSPCAGFGKAVTLLESLPDKPADPAAWNSGYGNKGTCLPVFLRNAAAEMKRLHDLAPAFRTTDSETDSTVDHTFAYRDMCVLVRGRSDAETAKRILAEYGIPYAYYKEQGVYDSVEAESLLAVFDYLADPGRKGRLEAVLLTPVCDVPPAWLKARLDSGDLGFSSLTEKWKELAARREWEVLFDSILNETCLAHPVAGDFEYDRRRMAVRQIFDMLLAKRGGSAQSIVEFADELRIWRKDDKAAGENGALRQKESEADCVQIMTMHVSKGLEYKVVFIAYGFGEIASLAEKDEKAAAIQEERRLLYVALTRAEYKLYLPWSEWALHCRMKLKRTGELESRKDEIGIGSVGSALLRYADPAKNKGFLAGGILAYYGGPAQAVKAVQGSHKPARSQQTGTQEKDSVETGASSAEIAEYGCPGYLGHLRVQWDSYSSLGHHSSAPKVMVDAEGRDKEAPTGATANVRRAETLLPRSNVSGDVFHEIMETLCGNGDTESSPGFRLIGQGDLGALQNDFGREHETPFVRTVRRIMRKHSVRNREKDGDSTERTLARMVWNALNTPIRVGDETFLLRDITAENRRAEMEFVIDEKSLLGERLPMLGGRERDGLFNGKIDLLVRPRGMDGPVFVIDWKTNSLDSFDDAKIEEAMTAAGYDLQYKLYSLAVNRWLGAGKLGGVAYLFVRGGEHVGGRSGVFVSSMTGEFLEDCLMAVVEALPNGKKGDGNGEK